AARARPSWAASSRARSARPPRASRSCSPYRRSARAACSNSKRPCTACRRETASRSRSRPPSPASSATPRSGSCRATCAPTRPPSSSATASSSAPSFSPCSRSASCSRSAASDDCGMRNAECGLKTSRPSSGVESAIRNPHSAIERLAPRPAVRLHWVGPSCLRQRTLPTDRKGSFPMNERTNSETAPPSQRPRSPRVPVNFTVELEGDDADGTHFRVTAEAVRISRGGATLIADVPAARGFSAEEPARALLRPSLEQLHDPHLMLGMREAAERVLRAVDAGERILIYGDYDVDGTTGTVVLRRALEVLGAQTGYHVPHRFTEGYGIRQDVLERAKAEGYKLVISVDCGIRAHEPLEW